MREFSLDNFLLNSKVEPKRLELFTQNEKNKPIPLRAVFFELSQTAKDYFTYNSSARMLALTGPRGIGKTTLMWQLAKEIYENYTQEIYFFNVEALVQLFGDTKLYLIFNQFEEIVLKNKFYELEKPIVFLFDEVHDAENWSKGLKILYDECPRAFIVCTGSSALLLHSNPDLASRWNLFHVFPFKFSEFIQAQIWKKLNKVENQAEGRLIHENLKNDLKRVLFFSEDFESLNKDIEEISKKIKIFISTTEEEFKDKKKLLLDYVNYYNIPRFFAMDNIEKIFEQTVEMFEKILQTDVPKWLKKDSMGNIFPRAKKLLIRLAFSGEIQVDALSRESDCKKDEVILLIDAFTKAGVLNQFMPFGRINAKLNKNQKIFFMSPTLRLSLREKYDASITPALQGILYEEIVAMNLKRLFSEGQLSITFSSEKDQKSPDFVIDTMESPIVLEIKTKKISANQIAHSGIKYRYGILICAEAEDYSFVADTLVIPLSWFLLL